MQFDKLVSALIGVHAFTVLGPQVLVLQKMLAAVWPTGQLSLPQMHDSWHITMMHATYGLVSLIRSV